MQCIVITNNPLVKKTYENKYELKYFDVGYKELLEKVKQFCEKGHKLLSHPLSGSVKPLETPYKSVLVSKSINEIDVKSLRIIINSIDSCEKFDTICSHTEAEGDFQIVDLSLIASALESSSVSNV